MNKPARTISAASTKDILNGFRPPRVVIAPQWRDHYARLLEIREQMLSHKASMVADAKEEQPGFSEHMGDAGTDQYDQDFALSMISSDQQSLYEIDEALSRIRNGTYGICELTGQPIEADRLEAIPWARFRVDAQRELEKTGSVARPHFGKIEKISSDSSGDDDDGDDDSD